MKHLGHLEIIVRGEKGNLSLSPEVYDIRDIATMLSNVEDLLFPTDNRNRPMISYALESGSVKHVFRTTMQTIIGFNALLGQIADQQTIDFLELKTAQAIEAIQDAAIKQNYSFTIRTSIDQSEELIINRSTNFVRSTSFWADAEFYFYGKVTNAGGKEKANIHISTERYGSLRIHTPIDFLEHQDENILYKSFGIRAKGKQNTETGELDTASLEFIALIDYQPDYDAQYLHSLREKATKKWIGKINPDEWLNEIRGGYDA